MTESTKVRFPGLIVTDVDWERNKSVQFRLAGILEPKLEHRETFPVWREAVRLLRAEVYDAHQFERTPMQDVAHREAALDRFEVSVGRYAESLLAQAANRDQEQRDWIAQQWDEHFLGLGI